MNIGHDPVIAADPGHAGILTSTPVQSAELADRVVITNLQTSRLTVVFLVLGSLTNGTELKKFIALPYTGMRPDDDVRADAGSGADLGICADNRIRTNLDISGKACPRINNGCWMYACTQNYTWAGRSRTVHISSASAATTSSTRACAENFHIPRT